MATISGAVFNDLNANGLKDGGESGESGWTVYLDADGNGQLGTGETTATTAENGTYSFSGLAAGTYTLAEVQQLGWQQTSPPGTVPGIERVSVNNEGTQADNVSSFLSISADGRFVAFSSGASNLVPGDTNGFGDAFVTANPFAPVPGSHVVALEDIQVVSGIDFGNTSLTAKFYVVNDASLDRTYEYNASGTSVENVQPQQRATPPRAARPARSRATRSGSSMPIARSTSTTPAADCSALGLPVRWPRRPRSRASPPTARTCGSSMPRATRSTSTPGPRPVSPAVRTPPAASA